MSEFYTLYLPPNGVGAEASRRALRAVDQVQTKLRTAGISIEVHTLRRRDVENRKVLAALRARGIHSLPALVSALATHNGCRQIEEHLKSAIKLQTVAPTNALDEEGASVALESFMRMEITGGE